ncbi:hypothetical protein PR202_gb29701 [Eleusine coracana subsp. coracana]|uniref:Uncharacterized protein n=1 Tax=Eleusine coracana subsp. coracana TaxID=191504 RepID=A0AAV5G118_ELECO|nr:hypothetical protein PR202_gb29701 [Eleusine coracana subsp. coracana]
MTFPCLLYLCMKGIIKMLGIGDGELAAAVYDFRVLHWAAYQGHLEVCKYLVEEHGIDVNMAGPDEGVTPLMTAAMSDHISVVKYLLDCGGDPMQPDENGATALHHAAGEGSSKVTEFLLSKGIPVDIDFNGRGTPLLSSIKCDEDNTLKILLDHHANVCSLLSYIFYLLLNLMKHASLLLQQPNTVFIGSATPLMMALLCRSLKCMKLLIEATTEHGGFTNFIRFLLKAGADPNIRDNNEGSYKQPAALYTRLEGKKANVKSEADKAFRMKDYKFASGLYGMALNCGEDAALYSNRSLCKLKMGDGAGALLDANRCRMMRPDWAKAYYRQAAAHMLLKDYKQACDALLDAKNLDPGSEEIERELR